MRLSHLLGSCAVAALATAIPASAALIANPGFENGTGSDADGWSNELRLTTSANTGTYGGEGTVGQGAEKRIQYDRTAAGSITPGVEYLYTVDLRADTALVGVDSGVWIQYFKSTGEFAGQVIKAVNITSSYQTFAGTFGPAPAEADRADIFVRLAAGAFTGAGGTFSVDNFQVSAVPEPAALGLLAMGVPMMLRRRRVG